MVLCSSSLKLDSLIFIFPLSLKKVDLGTTKDFLAELSRCSRTNDY